MTPIQTETEHRCRAEPHCVCGDNAWYHHDEEPGECGADWCSCKAFRRCEAWGRT